MNNTKHTPGPWVVDTASISGDRIVKGASDQTIAQLHWHTASDANAHLVAAAPAMYEALKETMQVLRSLRDNKEEWYTLVTPELLSAWDKNKQALSQAEGQQL